MSDIGAFSNINLFTNALSKYIVTPVAAFGLGGFVFDVEGDSTVTLSSDITDHFTEDNTAVQDHIAIRPKRFVLRSYVGELVHRTDERSNTKVQQVARKLTTLANVLPKLTAGAAQAKALIQSGSFSPFAASNITSETVNKVADYWSIAKNTFSTQTRAQQAFQYFKAMQEQKILFGVQTPFEFVANMAIESVTGVERERSKSVTDFSVTLKEMRFAATLEVPYDPAKYQERAAVQAQPISNAGNLQGVTAVPKARAGAYLTTDQLLGQGFTQADINAATLEGRAGRIPEKDLFQAFQEYGLTKAEAGRVTGLIAAGSP